VTALLLVGHGSLYGGAGGALRRVAALSRASGPAPETSVAFINFSRPSPTAALDRLARLDYRDVVVLPYFLIGGHYVRRVLPAQLAAAAASTRAATGSWLELRIAEPFGYHPALVDLVLERAQSSLAASSGQCEGKTAALLLMAHGTPEPEDNAPIHRVAHELQLSGAFSAVEVGFLEINRPGIGEAVGRLIEAGAERLVAVPYFLHYGGHVRADLPATVREARRRHPGAEIGLAPYLGCHPLLLTVIGSRFEAALA
jgi:sirohydrochlorin ferrochelatase